MRQMLRIHDRHTEFTGTWVSGEHVGCVKETCECNLRLVGLFFVVDPVRLTAETEVGAAIGAVMRVCEEGEAICVCFFADRGPKGGES